jgi:uncharacterized membrane protein
MLIGLIILAIAVYMLWERIGQLQARIELLEQTSWWHQPEERPAREPARVVEAEVDGEPRDEPIPVEAAQPAPAVVSEKWEEIEAEPVDDQAAPSWRDGFSFEDIFGRRLPIWAGGITLAIAGLLIVKYSIDAGLLSPSVRVIGGLLFGSVLIGAAELAYRFEERVGDERVRQALAGAGIATLYGAVLVAANLYGLIGPGPAFIGMAAITALALGLSLRFGAPSAMLGLAGGLAAPALVGSDNPSIPLLTAYLALTVGALGLVSHRREWVWLRSAALVGGFVWTAYLLASGALDQAGSVAVGLLMLFIGFVVPALRRGGNDDRIQWLTGIAAAAQVAALVASGGFTMLDWGLFGLLSSALIWLSLRSPAHGRLPAIGVAVALMLLLAWPLPEGPNFAIVLAGAVLLYGGWAFRRLWSAEGSMVEAGSLAALGFGAMAVPWYQFEVHASAPLLGAVGAGASLIPALAAWAGWRRPERRDDARFATLVIAAAATLAGAAMIGLPAWSVAVAFAAIAVALERVMEASGERRLVMPVVVVAVGSVLALLAGAGAFDEWIRLTGNAMAVEVTALLRWSLLSLALAWLAHSRLPRRARVAAQAGAALAAYGAVAQVFTGYPLATIAAAMTAALALVGGRKLLRTWRPAVTTLLVVSGMWMVEPLAQWLAPGVQSLGGQPFMIGSERLSDLAWTLAAPAALLWLSMRQAAHRMTPALRRAMMLVAGSAAAVTAHLLFKQMFHLSSIDRFVALAVAERAVWEALLLGGAALALQLGRRRIALGFASASLLHAAIYSMLYHNPLWAAQWVGPLPLLNLLPLAYAPPLATLWLLGRIGVEDERAERMRKLAPALPIALLAFSLLRQMFEGAILSNPGVTSGEDIARSVLAVLLGIGFLLWGIARKSRDWRILSLAVMIAAVGKVFLLDAAGLDGLARIGSFLALGLSLIGIGWLYSRFLARDEERPPPVGAAASPSSAIA